MFPRSQHPAIRRVKHDGTAPSIHGTKLWNASRLLIDYLNKNRPEQAGRVMDAGCGWCIGGIWCARRLGSEVTSVDADEDVFPYLDAVASINGVSTRCEVARFEQITKHRLRKYDMLIAADICFWDELVRPVYNLVNRAVKAGVKHIVLADPGRPTFLEMAERSVDKHCAELLDWQVTRGKRASGYLLVIENA